MDDDEDSVQDVASHPPIDISDSPQSYHVDDESLIVAISRLGRQRGKGLFTNAKAVIKLFNDAISRQTVRLFDLWSRGMQVDQWEITREDIIGPPIDRDTIVASEAYKQLMAMVGLSVVKQEIDKMLDMVTRGSVRAEKAGLLNRVFLGNPGKLDTFSFFTVIELLNDEYLFLLPRYWENRCLKSLREDPRRS